MRYNAFQSILLLPLLLLLCESTLHAQEIPSPPTQDIYLADFATMVDQEARQEILALGDDLDSRFDVQLVVVTVETLGGEDIETYANTLFRSWGIGDAKQNNGVLLLIAKNDRQFRVEVGYGLEGAIPDGFAGEVLDGMIPYFRNGSYSLGILGAYQKLARKIYSEYGEELPETVRESQAKEVEWTFEDYCYVAIGLLIFLVCIVATLYYLYKILKALLFIVTLGHWGSIDFLGGSGSGYSGSGSSGGSSSHSYSSSSSSSGGFGGGSSGGGGASGRW